MATKAANKKTGDGRSLKEAAPSVIPVIQEQATISKRVVETGKVRISKRVREYEELVDVPHIQEEVKIERVPIDQFVETAPKVRTEGDVTIIPVVAERYVLEKKLVLVEELRVRTERTESHQPQTIKVLKEEVEVKRIPPSAEKSDRPTRAKARH